MSDESLSASREARARDVLRGFDCLAGIADTVALSTDCVDELLYLANARDRADRLYYTKLALEMRLHRLKGENARARDKEIAMALQDEQRA